MRCIRYATTFSVTSSPSDPGLPGGIVSMMWRKSWLTGREPQALLKLGPVNGGASLDPVRSPPWQPAQLTS